MRVCVLDKHHPALGGVPGMDERWPRACAQNPIYPHYWLGLKVNLDTDVWWP